MSGPVSDRFGSEARMLVPRVPTAISGMWLSRDGRR
jgi:hypothetical protein